jgi:hypothetical protein
MQAALTLLTNPNYFPEGSAPVINPTNRQWSDGVSTIPKYLFKANGAYTFPWDITASANFNFYQGSTRTVVVDGPGDVFGGLNARGAATVITYDTLEFQSRDAERLEPVTLLDVGIQKSFRFGNGRNRLKLMLDGFNMFNVNTVQSYASSNRSISAFNAPDEIIPPRVFSAFFGSRSAMSANVPPSPPLSARMTNVRYFTTMTSVSAQKKSERMPSTFAGETAVPCGSAKHSFIA